MSEPYDTPSRPTSGIKLSLEVSAETAQALADVCSAWDRRNYEIGLKRAGEGDSVRSYVAALVKEFLPLFGQVLAGRSMRQAPPDELDDRDEGINPKSLAEARRKVFDALWTFGLTAKQGLAFLDQFEGWDGTTGTSAIPAGHDRESWSALMGRVSDAIRLIGVDAATLRAILQSIISQHGGERWDGPVTNPEPEPEGGAS